MKLTHAEGSGPILKSRFARGMFPLVAAFLACALAAPEARAAAPTDFAKKMTLTPSTSALAKISETAWTDFPVLVRLPAAVSSQLQAADGTDLYFEDESEAPLAFEVETFNPDGTTFVWVKVPSLSSATRLTVYFGGSENVGNDPTAVWSRYVGVWHFDADAAGTTTVADATGHALDATTAGDLTAVDGPFGDRCLRSSASTSAPDFEAGFAVGATFTASGWFKAPEMTTSDYVSPAKKKGSTWDAANGWYLEMPKDTGKLQILLTGNAPSTTLSDVRSNWHYFEVVSGGGSVKVYLDGATSPKITSTYTIVANSEPYRIQASKMLSDEYRIRKGAASASETALEYATMKDAAFFGMGEIESVDATAQEFQAPTIVRNANGTYTVTVVLRENSGDVGAIYDSGETAVTNVIQAAASPGTYTDTPANLTANTTYKFAAYGKNANGTEVVAKGGVFYTGDISIEKISDANENGLVTGVFRISRADTAHDLAVTYTVSGTAAAGQTYAALSGTATIPAGSTSVDVEVVPLLDAATTEDKTVALTLATGLYGINAQAGSAEMTVVNLVVPTGFNTWVAPADGLASVDSNWSAGHAPLATEQVLFDGRFSTANCEWDAAASATVASWTQTNGYTGTVTFDTEFPDYSGATFPLFTISGDCVIASGKWSCRGNYNNYGAEKPSYTYKTDKRWCLNVAVGGAMQVASGASITATGRGFGFPNDSSSASKSYGGYAYGGGTSPYGSIKEPFDPGMGARAQGDQNGRISAIGGGAIKLAVTGNLTLNGSVVALGTIDQNVVRAGGTGGSIWIVAAQISGVGTIDASACPRSYFTSDLVVGVPSGGRVALYTQSPLALPIAKVSCNGTCFKGSKPSGPGTIYVYDPTQTDGTLYIRQSADISTSNSKWVAAPVMGDLALDAVVFSGSAQLRIPTGASLALPSLSAVTTDNTSAGRAGIAVDGGSLDIGSGDQTLKANVAFAPVSGFNFPGNLTLETGAHLGNLLGTSGSDAADFDTTYTVSVAGDLTIPAGASAGASTTAGGTASNKARYAASHGGQSLYLAVGARTNGFDSVLNPSMPGGSAKSAFPAGGVFTLTVGGTLTLDGAMRANGGEARGSTSTYDGTSAGAGGTINVTAGALAGTGVITADGGCGRYNYAGGAGGGRVAVRLTGADSTFSDWWTTNVFARGESFASGNGKASSAGTVYLQTAADGEAGGCVTIRNDLALQAGATNNLATTRYPGNGDGCDAPSALKKTRLLIDGASRVELTDDLRLIGLTMASDTVLDLNGKTLAVRSAMLGNVKLAPGTYAAGSTVAIGGGTLADYLVDTAEGAGGALVVSGGGFRLSLR